jgi:hypothetical protein
MKAVGVAHDGIFLKKGRLIAAKKFIEDGSQTRQGESGRHFDDGDGNEEESPGDGGRFGKIDHGPAMPLGPVGSLLELGPGKKAGSPQTGAEGFKV